MDQMQESLKAEWPFSTCRTSVSFSLSAVFLLKLICTQRFADVDQFRYAYQCGITPIAFRLFT